MSTPEFAELRAEPAPVAGFPHWGTVRWCAGGLLGIRPTKDLMPVALAAAGRLAKYGA